MKNTTQGFTLSDLKQALELSLAPNLLEVRNDSEQHAGHAGHRPGYITHVYIHLKSPKFQGKSRLEKHRMANEALHPFFDKGLHAVQMQLEG